MPNRKIIYEGDILSYLGGDRARGGYKEVAGGYYEVFFDRYKFRMRRLDNDRFVRTVNFGLVDNRPKEFEIIGNIYENHQPALRESTTKE